MRETFLTALLGIQGYNVTSLERIGHDKEAGIVKLSIERGREEYICGKCGQVLTNGYDHTWQEVRHLTLWHHQTILRFPRYRVDCPSPSCAVKGIKVG